MHSNAADGDAPSILLIVNSSWWDYDWSREQASRTSNLEAIRFRRNVEHWICLAVHDRRIQEALWRARRIRDNRATIHVVVRRKRLQDLSGECRGCAWNGYCPTLPSRKTSLRWEEPCTVVPVTEPACATQRIVRVLVRHVNVREPQITSDGGSGVCAESCPRWVRHTDLRCSRDKGLVLNH